MVAMTTARGYKRVSTKEQGEEGFSLSAQDLALIEYCKRNNIHLKGMYEDDCTGTNFDRPGFTELLKANQKEPVNFVLFTKWTRFSRDTTNSYAMIRRLKKQGTDVQAIEEKVDINIPQDQIMLALRLVMPQVDNEMRRDTTMRGTIQARTEGRHTGTAPTGYKNARDEQRKPIIIPDLSKAPYVRKAFEMIFEGKTQSEARELLRKEGYKVVRSHFHTMLRNEVYIGNILVPAYKNEPQKTVKGIHEPLITESLFYQVQDILNGKKRTQPRKRLNTSEHFPLKGFLYCFEYNHKLTGSCSCGHGGKYHYYHCQNNHYCERYPAKRANDEFERRLRMAELDEEVAYITAVEIEQRLKVNPHEIRLLNTKIAQQETRIELLIDSRVQAHISQEDFTVTRARYETELKALKTTLEDLNLQGKELTSELDNCLKMLTRLPQFYKNTPPENKADFIGSIIEGKLNFDGNKYRTFSFSPVIELLSNGGKGFSEAQKNEDKRFSPLVLSRSGGRTLYRTLPKNEEVIASIRKISRTFKMLRA